MQVSILSERRVHAPYGLEGGGSGSTGLNLWVKAPVASSATATGKPRAVNIGGKSTIKVSKGDRLVLHTPGGGAWGAREDGVEEIKEVRTVGWGGARGSLVEYAAKQAGF